MKKINISEEANRDITQTLESIILDNSSNELIESMYLKEYENNGIPTVELVIVTNEGKFPLRKIEANYRDRLKELQRKYGINVRIGAVLSSFIVYFPNLNIADIDIFDLILLHRKTFDFMNSKVVYDPHGIYTKLQRSLIDACTNKEEYDNVVEFVPPLNLERVR